MVVHCVHVNTSAPNLYPTIRFRFHNAKREGGEENSPIISKPNNRIPKRLITPPNLPKNLFPPFPHPGSIRMIPPNPSPKTNFQPPLINSRHHPQHLIEIRGRRTDGFEEVVEKEKDEDEGVC